MTEEIIKAIIASVGTIVVAALVLTGTILSSRKPSKDKAPTGDVKPLAEFNGTQNEFMALVIQDNTDLRRQLGDYSGSLEELKETVNSIKTHQEGFLAAVRRYLMKLATAWAGPDPMPWPDDADFHILEETLPKQSVKGLTNNKETR